MTHKLILASAGAGKSRSIITQALEKSASGQTVLLLTYTENNQKELLKKICEINSHKPSNIIIKGWFTFLLEELIRPYQGCIFQDRISKINFNKKNPHKTQNGKNIPGTAEKTMSGVYNPAHYLTKAGDMAHTINLAKLAYRIIQISKKKPIQRIEEIYSAIYIDEVQDLVGYDFNIIEAIFNSGCKKFVCVGDFRQTIYTTSIAQKLPRTSKEKLKEFERIGFKPEHMSISWRCIQQICDFSDLVHADENYYPTTSSKVDEVPNEFYEHQGVFAVSAETVSEYIKRYSPVILRLDRTTQVELCDGCRTYNFGEAKGLGFDRVLILPTEKHRMFLSGKDAVFDDGKTEKAKNTFYVSITRARYSLAFFYDGDNIFEHITRWNPT